MKENTVKTRAKISVSTKRDPVIEADILKIKKVLSEKTGLNAGQISDSQAIIYAITKVAKEEKQQE